MEETNSNSLASLLVLSRMDTTPFRPVATVSSHSTSSHDSHSRKVLLELNRQDNRLKEIELKNGQSSKDIQKKLESQEKATEEILQQLKALQEQLATQIDKPRRLPSVLTVSLKKSIRSKFD